MLSLKSLLVLLALFAAGLAVWRNWQARERAERLARETCRRMGVQLLDETVAQKRWRLVRQAGRWMLRRTYAFEFSRNGADRWPGELVLLGGRLEGVEFNLVDPLGSPPPQAPGVTPRPEHPKVIPLKRDHP